MAFGQTRCVNPAGVSAWSKLADTYASMGKRVEEAASLAAEAQIAAPARDAGAHPDTGVFSREDDHFVGVPQGHPNFDSALETEFGGFEDLSKPPGAQIRTAIWNNRDAAIQTFHERLAG